MRIIGDVHGKLDPYIRICKKAEDEGQYTLQLGDLSLNKLAYRQLETFLNPEKHKFIPGNHDYYPKLPAMSLGDYGMYELGGITFFFIRGAFSIDKKWRTPKIDWFEEEELTDVQLNEAYELYIKEKPDLVFSHDAPRAVGDAVGNPRILMQCGFDPHTFNTRTSIILQKMFETHQPERWYFGHFHNSKVLTTSATRFQCLDELEYVDI